MTDSDHHSHRPFQLYKNVLIERLGRNKRIIYGRWNRQFGCWFEQNNTKPDAPTIPYWEILELNGAPIIFSVTCNSRFPADESGRLLKYLRLCCADLNIPPDYEIRGNDASALVEYYEEIPIEVRRLAAPFGVWQWTILEGIRYSDEFGEFLNAEISSFGRGFVVACLALAQIHRRSKHVRLRFLKTISRGKRQRILRLMTGMTWTKSAMRTLREFDAKHASDYKMLIANLRSTRKSKILARGNRLSAKAHRKLCVLPDWICEPKILPFLENDELLTEFDVECLFLATDQIREKIQNSLRNLSSDSDFEKCVKRWRHYFELAGDFPSPPVPADNLLLPLDSVQKVKQEGIRMRNCLNGPWKIQEALNGNSYFYVWQGSQRLNIELEKVGENDWTVSEIGAIGNGFVHPNVEKQARQYIEELLR